MKRAIKYWVTQCFTVGLLMFLGTQVAHAEVTGNVEVNPRLVRLGSTFEVTVNIYSDKSIQVINIEFPVADGISLSNPEVRKESSVNRAGRQTQYEHFQIASYTAEEAGMVELGPFRVNFDTDDLSGEEILIDPVVIEIYDDAPRPASNIIIGKTVQWWRYLIIPALLALLAGLIWALIAIKRKKQAGTPAPVLATVFRTLEQITLEKINGLEFPKADDLPKVREYYDRVDEILREYLGKRFEMKITDATSYEIRLEFHRRQRIESRAAGVLKLINDCDWVKFAKCKPTQNEIHDVPVRASRTLLGSTTESI